MSYIFINKNEYNKIGSYDNFSRLKQIKIIDCFTFYNELELLNYRLNILNDVVDYFIIVESTHTHVGKEKELIFQNNRHLFKKFLHKIIHIIVDNFPHKYPNIDIGQNQQWTNEKFQRNCISRGIDTITLNDEDCITITDLDEIPDPIVLSSIKNNFIKIESINSFEMDFYYYNLNCIFKDKWYHGKIINYKYYKNNNTLDNIRFTPCSTIKRSGWHLSYFGDPNFIKNKILNFTHQEFNSLETTDETKIEEKIKKGTDLFNREGQLTLLDIKDNNYLPPMYDIYLKKFYS